jgi:hypothetical protein
VGVEFSDMGFSVTRCDMDNPNIRPDGLNAIDYIGMFSGEDVYLHPHIP